MDNFIMDAIEKYYSLTFWPSQGHPVYERREDRAMYYRALKNVGN
jgi:hypothetical protein